MTDLVVLMAAASSGIDYFGAEGGRLAMAFAAGCVSTSTFLTPIGLFFWRYFGQNRNEQIAQLKEDLKAERADCDRRMEKLTDRIKQLETMLLLHGTGPLRQAMQAAISETRVGGDEI